MRFPLLLWMIVVAFGLCGVAPAGADSLYADCASVVDGEDEQIQCQVRSINGKSLSAIRPELVDGGEITYENQAYSWTANKSAWYFLVQVPGMTRSQLSQISSFLERAAFPAGQQAIGIAQFTDSFDELAALGSYRSKLSGVAEDIKIAPKSDATPALETSLREAIVKISALKSDRKALVLLSDGDPDNNSFNKGDIIRLAKREKVAIYVLFFGQKDKERSSALTGLGEDTFGAAHDLSDMSRKETQDFAPELFRHLENGKVLNIDARGLPQLAEFKVTADLQGKGNVSSDLIQVNRQTEDPWHLRSGSYLWQNLIAIVATLGLAAGVVLIAGPRLLPHVERSGLIPAGAVDRLKTLAGRGAATPSGGDDATHIIAADWNSAEETAQAWLQLVDSDEPPVPLHAGSMRIGRHENNDIQLTNRSVHRQHAILQMSPAGQFSVHDLGTKNGIYINGSRHKQHDLSDGDMIELGEVKLRFISNPE